MSTLAKAGGVPKNNSIQIGSRVRLKSEHSLFNKTFEQGHEFTVYDSSYRGWDLVDDDGYKIYECLFIHDKLELI
jgi:hypothetical protein